MLESIRNLRGLTRNPSPEQKLQAHELAADWDRQSKRERYAVTDYDGSREQAEHRRGGSGIIRWGRRK